MTDETKEKFQITPVTLILNKNYKMLKPKTKELLMYMRYHYYVNDEFKNGIFSFPLSVACEYGIFTLNGNKEMYKHIKKLVDFGFIEIVYRRKHIENVYKIID